MPRTVGSKEECQTICGPAKIQHKYLAEVYLTGNNSIWAGQHAWVSGSSSIHEPLETATCGPDRYLVIVGCMYEAYGQSSCAAAPA